jgi:hypothetical protein
MEIPTATEDSNHRVQFEDTSVDETQYNYYKPEVQDPVDMTRYADRTSNVKAALVSNRYWKKFLLIGIVIGVVYIGSKNGGGL